MSRKEVILLNKVICYLESGNSITKDEIQELLLILLREERQRYHKRLPKKKSIKKDDYIECLGIYKYNED